MLIICADVVDFLSALEKEGGKSGCVFSSDSGGKREVRFVSEEIFSLKVVF